ncbi:MULTISPECIES: hypothetical protein [Nostocales]|uniref:Uncharacterized protein n=1 Tax=Nostoc punctiforme FACHB-252 TaxID=1357509 RepID=A0ABR8HFZ8_NOSPU|nr:MULTISPECIES: hypothetical protein [Nostocales]MBD2614023.1 hypothetical protein [Nostoc punctiforme FACHB-252]MBE9080671.1 hypothetical protein [Tolypothrix sp. LEGE 11397]UYD30374.1 hypothetical protein HGR01_35825 [Tolypothrix sp. PCC 7712]UYD38184.1 hypothetical protein HG267_37430 [Tolypothrix sp. PCC 7601]
MRSNCYQYQQRQSEVAVRGAKVIFADCRIFKHSLQQILHGSQLALTMT